MPAFAGPAWLLAAVALGACATSTPSAPALTLVIEDITVVDVIAGELRRHAWVGIREDRIVAVGRPADMPPGPGARRVDGRGQYLIPGLWDMHAHALWSGDAIATFLPAYVAYGVTGIRDMGGTLEVLQAVRDSLRAGSTRVPRVYAAGPMLDGAHPVDPDISVAIGDSAAARRAVDSLVAGGADFIKVYTLLSREAYFAVLDAASRVGVSVAGHVPGDITVEEAARAGQRSIEHLREEIEPYCLPADPAACAAVMETFRQQHTWQVPTLAVARLKAFADDSSLAMDPRLGYIPAALREAWLTSRTQRLARGPDYFTAKRERYQEVAWLAGTLFRAGIPLLAGSDAGVPFSYPGSSLHEEMALLAAAGLPALDALRTATLNAAIFLGATDSMGSIQPGKLADLVLLGANPLDDIGAVRNVSAVILRGRFLDRSDLDALLEEVANAAR